MIGFFYVAIIAFDLGRKKVAWAFFTIMLCWFLILATFYRLISHLGMDSFYELRDFAWIEAWHYIATIWGNQAMTYSYKVYILWSSVFIVSFSIIFYTNRSTWGLNGRWRWYRIFSISMIFLCVIVVPTYTFQSNYYAFQKSANIQSKVESNFLFDKDNIEVKNMSGNTNVFLYLGESTSSLNMQLYDYPRNTTPLLNRFKNQNKKNLIVVENVWSTHTHTSSSLLEALSLSADSASLDEKVNTIFDRKRISLPDILKLVDIETYLFSNQGRSGTSNFASSIIFKDSNNTYSKESSLDFGDYDENSTLDHELLNQMLDKNLFAVNKEKSLYVFQSYAGHGPYKENLPPKYIKLVDDYFLNTNNKAIFGENYSERSIEDVESYDSAISYIDSNLTKTMEYIKSNKKPIIFIYTSDHGESPYTSRGHDSSRFIIEMASVPFLVYFNDAAILENQELFTLTKKRLKTNDFASLAQLSDTIIEFLGVEVKTINNDLYKKCPVGVSGCIPKYLIVRDMGNKFSFVRTKVKEVVRNQENIDITDDASEHSILAREVSGTGIDICYHRSNSIAKVIRGIFASNCVELDILINDKNIDVTHPPHPSTGLSLSKVIDIVSRSKKSKMWIDGKNIDIPKNCDVLSSKLKEINSSSIDILVEFPSSTINNLSSKQLQLCISRLRKSNIAVSYYIPTNDGIQCASSINNLSNNPNCAKLSRIIKEVNATELFTDISFDYGVFQAIEKMNIANNFKWNTWNISSKDILNLPYKKFRFVIPENKDPNNY